jgi:hypothetical protein
MPKTSTNARWQTEAKDQVHVTLAAVFRTVRDETAWRVDADEYHAGLYCASDKPGIRGSSRKGYEYGPATLPYNVCRSATDTLTAKVAKHRPLPQVLTQKGSWKNQKRARKQTQFLEGEFYRQRVYEKHAPRIVRDAGIFGRGALKIYTYGKDIKTERAHVWELYADEYDGRYGLEELRNLYHCRSVDKGVLLERFGRTESGGMRKSIKDALDSAGRFAFIEDQWDDHGGMTVDRVDVIEAWHLPSSKDAGDGRHVIIVEGATLLDEEWTYEYFPFAILNYSDPVVGCWGHGLIEQAEGYQYEINLASEKSSEQHHMSGVGILVPDNAKIYDQQIRNGITQIHHKAGGQPSVFQMDLVNEHTRQRPRELTQDALNDMGMSQMSVQSAKPAGITAAIALQTLDDIETERFMIFGRAYEAWNLEVARRFIDCAKQIARDYGDHSVSVPMKGGLVDLNWNDIEVEGAELKIHPTSLLPQQLGARLEKLKDMWNTGLLDRAAFLRHLDAPDLQAELDLETADQLVVDEMLERMSEAEEEEGEAAYMPPSAYQQLQDPAQPGKPGWALKRCQQRLNRGILDGMPEFNQEMLRRFLKDGDELIKTMNPPPAAPMAPAGPGIVPPPGAVAPPPDLPGLGIPRAA